MILRFLFLCCFSSKSVGNAVFVAAFSPGNSKNLSLATLFSLLHSIPSALANTLGLGHLHFVIHFLDSYPVCTFWAKGFSALARTKAWQHFFTAGIYPYRTSQLSDFGVDHCNLAPPFSWFISSLHILAKKFLCISQNQSLATLFHCWHLSLQNLSTQWFWGGSLQLGSLIFLIHIKFEHFGQKVSLH